MIAAIYSVFIVICIALIVVVLLQAGKGAGLGAAFGGSSQTVFGSQGRASFLTKTTAGLATAFMIISLFLAWNSSRTFSAGVMQDYKEAPAPQGQPGEMPSPGAGQSQPMTLPDWPAEQPAGEQAATEAVPEQETGVSEAIPDQDTPTMPLQPGPSE
jgi:preprotein translocase subunit SecG